MHDSHESTRPISLRLWPGVAAAVLLVLIRFILPVVAPETQFFGVDAQLIAVLGSLAMALAILVWWLFFSRARWSERVLAIGVMIVAILAIRPLTHISIQNGMMGMMFFIYAVPATLSLAFVLWAVATRRLPDGPRRMAMAVAILIGCGVWTLARSNGILGGVAELEWRWTPTAEERLLAQVRNEPPLPPPSVAAEMAKDSLAKTEPAVPTAVKVDPAAPASAPDGPALSERGRARVEWPGFRGPDRDGVIRDVTINSDWSTSPPVQIWRRAIGPGWSSFAVSGDLLYTQEQRGDDEIVACYRVSTGEPVWQHRDPIRFWEPEGGAGPRGTPAVHNRRVFAMGATGVVNALDAGTGALLWSRNAATDTGVTVPDWGVASSPLVIGDVVIVAVSGRLAGYDAVTGNPKWLGPTGGAGYSSPHLATIDGVPQVLLLRGSRTISLAPADGALLWEHMWQPGVSIVQPAVVADRDVLITSGDAMGGLGIRRLAVTRGSAGWTADERWTSRGLKPYFNDFVVHKGHAYGFDGNILSAIDLGDGTRKWKGGRYGNGQMILLAEQDLLLVMSEDGELALVSATPDKHTEVARFPVFDAKTWNHPVLIGDVLLVRNGEEMAAFRMPLAGR
ncbi:MAG TPA: PQQ-binding-like beta-propeller repeat protein [Vicinamibacterales bacterium]|nr:PQQ-binding-like beta-propeller repeat protein [Vicinamibacterales bacterium]